jgi:serine phosphatase RsbU (regulator of sigma subunit)
MPKGSPPEVNRGRGGRRPRRLSAAVLVIGLVVTGALTATSQLSYLHNEQRLDNLQTNLTASALGIAPVDLERRLGQAAAAAGEAQDPAATFRRVIAPSMAPAGPFVIASLALVRQSGVRILAEIGAKPINPPRSSAATALFERAAHTGTLITTRLLGSRQQRFGYLLAFAGRGGTYVATAGEALPGNRRITVPSSSPDAGLNVAIYFGKAINSASLIETNAPHLPLTGTVSTATVPFGSSVLTLVISPTSPLSGPWSQFLPWGLLIVGVLLSFGLFVMTERLVRRRGAAEILAEENRRLYGEQRRVSLALQRSLLPKVFPTIAGVDIAARYIPGESGVEVGGDWYSAVSIDEHRFTFIVGDVSGHGVAAAAVMAGLRYTIRAYAALAFNPAHLLEMASDEISVGTDGHFATVLVGLVDSARREITMASAGHPPALLLTPGHSEFIDMPIGVPLGLGVRTYESATIRLVENSVLIAYTDGLIERRDEAIEAGMERLRRVACAGARSADELVTTIVDSVLGEQPSDDDTAILAIRWEALRAT